MKRIFLELELLQSDILIEYNMNYYISSFIYQNFLTTLHDGNDIKHFTFSKFIIPKKKILKEGILINSYTIGLVISSSKTDIINNIENKISDKVYKIKNLYFKIKNYKIYSETLKNDVCHFKTLTPICINIRDNNTDKYLSPDNEIYCEQLRKNIEHKTNIKTPELQFYVISNTIKSELISIKNQKIKAYNFEFFINLNIKQLNIMFFEGFGAKCSQGLGMVELIK